MSFNSFYNFKSSSTRQHPLCIVPLWCIGIYYVLLFLLILHLQYLEFYSTLHIVPHQGRVVSKGSKNLFFGKCLSLLLIIIIILYLSVQLHSFVHESCNLCGYLCILYALGKHPCTGRAFPVFKTN